MAREGEAKLREFGGDDFRVENFRVDDEKWVDLTDDFDFHNRLYFLNFTAKIHFLRDFQVPSRKQIAARVGAADWTIDEAQRDLERGDLFSMNTFTSGTGMTLRAAAVFDDMEPGWRFDRLDSMRK